MSFVNLMLRQAFVVLGTLCLMMNAAAALDTVKIMIGANPGGGYDQTARSLGRAMIDAGVAKNVQYENKGGAGGTIALAQFITASKGDAAALIVTGAAMVGAVVQNKPPLTLSQATPIARLFYEYNVLVVPTASPVKTLKDVIDQLKRDPGSVKWAGGSRGSVDHIAVAQIARAVGVNPSRINYVPFQGGGEASAAILEGYVTVGISGWNEMAQHVRSGKMRALAVTSQNRLPEINIPTLNELGVDVEIGNWRGVYAAPGVSATQRKAIRQAVLTATQQASWTQAITRNAWVPALLSGDEFGKFVDSEHNRIEASMRLVGLIQ
jgi:putative tricarboxylic transport membrane protein